MRRILSRLISEMIPHRLFPYTVAAAAAALVYANTFGHGFVFDDLAGILNEPSITRFDHLGRYFREPWRGITQLSYAITFHSFGADARPFHATNILIHVINSVLVVGIARRAAGIWLDAERSAPFALAAGLMHAVHPLYTEGIAYVWGRSSSLCATFYFASLVAAMSGHEDSGARKYVWYGAAIVSGALAWMTKEEAITLPLLIAGFFFLTGSRKLAAGVLVVPVAIVLSRWNDIARLAENVRQNQQLVSAGSTPALEAFTFALTYVKASVFHYLGRFVVPVGQSADPQVSTVTTAADPLFIAALLVLAALVVWGVKAASSHRIVSFALLALLASPLAAYAFLPLADVVAERRVYIAGLGFDLLAGWLLTRSVRHSAAAIASVTLALSVLTFERNQVWASSLTLWQDTARKSPALARPHLNLGLAYQSDGQLDAAIAEYRRALAINPKLAPAYVNLAGIFYSRNDLDSAESALEHAMRLAPALQEPYVDLAAIALRKHEPAKALEFLDRAAALGESYLVHLNRGDALSQLRRYQEAVVEYQRAAALKPEIREQIDSRIQWLRSSGAIR
jgi:tetratricopeptide (TPR) repeat protein